MLKHTLFIYALAEMLVGVFGCMSPRVVSAQAQKGNYALHQPEHTYTLPDTLLEISGICLSADEKQYYVLQDEIAAIFVLDAATAAIVKTIPFGDKGDYEDVARVGTTLYALKSNGTITAIQEAPTTPKISTYKTGLGKVADTEGLCYDEKNNRLLIACKGIVNDIDSVRYVYAFELGTHTLAEAPVYTLTLSQLQQYVDTQKDNPDWKKTSLTHDDPTVPFKFKFGPAALAIHPITGQVCVVSAVNKLWLQLDAATGNITYMEKLDAKIHQQPEGIAFKKDGTLLLTNEGKRKGNTTKAATLTVYPYQPTQ